MTFLRPRHHRPAAEQLAEWPLLRDSLAALAARGHDVLALVSGHTDEAAPAGAARVRFVADGAPARALRRPSRLLQAARDFAPDVVHVHSLAFPVHTWWLMRAVRAPVLLQDHAGRPPRASWKRRLMRQLLAGARGVIFAVKDQVAAFVDAGVLAAAMPWWEVPGGSCTFTPGARDAARRQTGMTGEPCVLWIGLLTERKDPLTAVRALALASERLSGLTAYFCYGDAALEAEVRRHIAADRRLDGRVTLVGRIPHQDIEARLRAADVFLLATRREGWNLSSIEALACGTPVVSTDIPEQRALIGDGGRLFAPGDAAGAASALVEVAAGDATAWRHRARRRFETALSYEVMAERLETVYREVAGR